MKSNPKVLVCPDKFRYFATSSWLTGVIVQCLTEAGIPTLGCPLSDGGEGFLEVYGSAIGTRDRYSFVQDALGRSIRVRWGVAYVDGEKTAVLETGMACGLATIGGAQNNDPLRASTFGVGQLIRGALSVSVDKIVLGLGGSATSDGGAGALEALEPWVRLSDVEIVCACDVKTKFLDAPREFSPQKGASPSEVLLLTKRLEVLRSSYMDRFGVDVAQENMTGAGGGLAGGLSALGARLELGVDLVSSRVYLEDKIKECDLVITGEGFVDESSWDGKVVGFVSELAKSHDKPVVVITGGSSLELGDQLVLVDAPDSVLENSPNFAGLVGSRLLAWLDQAGF